MNDDLQEAVDILDKYVKDKGHIPFVRMISCLVAILDVANVSEADSKRLMELGWAKTYHQNRLIWSKHDSISEK